LPRRRGKQAGARLHEIVGAMVRLSATLRAGVLPARGWGRIDLAASQPRAGTEWTDDGASREELGKRARVNDLEPSMCGQACGRSLVIPADRLLSAVGAALLVSFPARGHSGA